MFVLSFEKLEMQISVIVIQLKLILFCEQITALIWKFLLRMLPSYPQFFVRSIFLEMSLHGKAVINYTAIPITTQRPSFFLLRLNSDQTDLMYGSAFMSIHGKEHLQNSYKIWVRPCQETLLSLTRWLNVMDTGMKFQSRMTSSKICATQTTPSDSLFWRTWQAQH